MNADTDPPDDLPNVCEHLRPIAAYIASCGGAVAYAGQAWSTNCRLWVYYDALLGCEVLLERFAPPACVRIHDHRGTHDGAERGLVCDEHHDALMGIHPAYASPTTQRLPATDG